MKHKIESFSGCVVFAALVAIMSLFGCTQDPSYSPETQNTLALKPMPQTACDSPPAWGQTTVRCDSFIVDYYVFGSWPHCTGEVAWTVGSQFQFTPLAGPWTQADGAKRFRSAIARYGTGSTVTATVELRRTIDNQCLYYCNSGGITSPNINCGGGHGGFEETGTYTTPDGETFKNATTAMYHALAASDGPAMSECGKPVVGPQTIGCACGCGETTCTCTSGKGPVPSMLPSFPMSPWNPGWGY